MRIALDATYSLDSALSGVGVYSREILNGAASSDFPAEWVWFYRAKRFWKARNLPRPAHVARRLLADSWGNRSADLFHGLNQRLPRRRFRRQIATFHDLFVMSGDYSTLEFRERFTAQAREAAAAADALIAVSAFTANQIENLLGYPRSQIRVIHHGTVPRILPQLPRENVVLCVGAIQRRKNQAGLVRAFAALPSDWRLVLAGSHGFEAGEVFEAISASPARDRIQVTGYASEKELAEWYARARIFAFPSLNEGFGMPILEAMAAGIPVIAANSSAMPEVTGDAAVLVDPYSSEEISQALRDVAEDENLRQLLIQRGNERTRLFSWSRAVNATLATYRELIA